MKNKHGIHHCLGKVLMLSMLVVIATGGLPGPAFCAQLTVRDRLEMFLADKYPWDEIEVSDVLVLGDERDGQPERIVVEKGPLGSAVFSFEFHDNERMLVKARVRAFERVVKSNRPFRRQHVLQEDDIHTERMDIRRLPSGAVQSAGSLIGKSLKRSVASNITITESMIEKSEVVKRGTRVTLIIEQDGLEITAAGLTKEKGYVGMPVRTINISSKREVTGVLIDENTVRVEI